MHEIKNMAFYQKPSTFQWKGLGDLKEGRVGLGDEVNVLVYRLLQYTMRDVLAREFSPAYAVKLLRACGYQAGIEFANNLLDLTGDFDYFITNLQRKMQELKIGILRIERADVKNFRFTLTMSEDLDCSGLPVTDETVCDFDEGFLAGILETYLGQAVDVKEVDCWATGDRTCRFVVEPNE